MGQKKRYLAASLPLRLNSLFYLNVVFKSRGMFHAMHMHGTSHDLSRVSQLKLQVPTMCHSAQRKIYLISILWETSCQIKMPVLL